MWYPRNNQKTTQTNNLLTNASTGSERHGSSAWSNICSQRPHTHTHRDLGGEHSGPPSAHSETQHKALVLLVNVVYALFTLHESVDG